jgi:hypothetical protein
MKSNTNNSVCMDDECYSEARSVLDVCKRVKNSCAVLMPECSITRQAGHGPAAARVLAAVEAPAVGAQGAAPVAEGAGDTEQRISRTVPGLPRGNLTVAVLKSRLQMYGGAMFVLDDNTHKTRYKAPKEHIFNKGAIKRAELLNLDRWKQWIVPGEMARAEAQASRAAAGVIDTLTTVLDALLASAVAVIEKDTLFRCVAEQIVERLPEGRRHFGHLCKGPQRVVCGDGGVADPCAALGDCAHLLKGVEHASAHLQRRRMDVLFLKYRTYGYDSARESQAYYHS